MRIVFHGLLRELYGESFDMKVDTIADAIEGFSRQQDNWPRGMRIAVAGFHTEESLQESPEEIHLLPAMQGGGGKWGSILLGAALIAAAFIPGLNAIAIGLKAAMLLGGVMMVLTGVMGLFMKSPKVANSSDPTASKYIGINTNTTAINTPITMAWGTIDLAGQWLSLQSDSINLSHGNFPVNPT